MDPAIQALLKRLQAEYETVMAADNPAAAAREWAGRMRRELTGPAWTSPPAEGQSAPAMSGHAVRLVEALDRIERSNFWRPESLSEFRAAAVRLGGGGQ